MNYTELISLLNEYLQSYNVINVKDKTILDIGADIGSSAFYFLSCGAKKVICYSNENQAIYDDRIEWHGIWKGEYIPADVLKIDCEGCECMLTKNIIEKYNEWYIAIHNFSNCFNSLKNYLEINGKLVFITKDKKELMYAKFI